MIPEIKEEELGNLQIPTALILGTNDNFLTQEKGAGIVAAIPNGTFYAINNSGHLPWLEDPKFVGQLILDFFKK